MQDRWWEQKAEPVQFYTNTNNCKMLCSAIMAIYGPSRSGTAPLRSTDGSAIIKDKDRIRASWEEHFNQLQHRPSTVDQEVLQQIPQKPLLEDFDLPPRVDEVRTAIKEKNIGKTSGADEIPGELYIVLGTTAFSAFHDILVSIWQEECVSADFHDVTIVTLYKNKGAKSDCGNDRGISLLCIAGKILARILLNRLITSVSESNLTDAQCGFRPGRSRHDAGCALSSRKVY